MRPQLATSLVLFSALAWTAALAFADVASQPRVLLMGVGLIVISTVGVVGLVVTGGLWAQRTALAGLAMTVVTALLIPIDPLWAVSAALTAFAVVALFQPRLGVRKLPSATGPPSRALLAPLALLVAPFGLGLAGTGSPAWALLAVGLSAPLAAFFYAGVKRGGLAAIRIVWPALAIGAVPALEMPAAPTSAAFGVLILALAWSNDAKVAFHPPREQGTILPIPPELSPADILDAADIDDRGRPR